MIKYDTSKLYCHLKNLMIFCVPSPTICNAPSNLKTNHLAKACPAQRFQEGIIAHSTWIQLQIISFYSVGNLGSPIFEVDNRILLEQEMEICNLIVVYAMHYT